MLRAIWDLIANVATFQIEWLIKIWRANFGLMALIGGAVYLMLNIFLIIINVLEYIADSMINALNGKPSAQFFPGGMEESVAFANAIFPVSESIIAFGFLATLWVTVATVRILKSLIPGWS